jgi:UDP-N-acetylglucosamine--N-acetylmuramyl-(pentapeptide) pyrophosphoryl-undecaprenol N-acetylglucosamine transferase
VSSTRPLSVLIAAGGSAGHVEPALAVADVLRTRGHTITVLGTAEGLESRLVPARGYPLELVPKVALPRRPGRALLSVPTRLRAAVTAARGALERSRADVVLGVGGYVSVPAYIAAWRAHVPIVVHEANPIPGIANRLGARLTHHVAISVPGTPLRHGVLTGLPLRPGITGLERSVRRAGARQQLGLPADGPVLLVTGGSQGSRRINTALTAAAQGILDAGIAVLHIPGNTHADSVTAAVSGVTDPAGRYVVLSYADDMAACYAAADLVLCRAGPAVDAGGAVLVADGDLDASWILEHLVPLLGDATRLVAMGSAARRLLPQDAATVVADMVEAAARETGHS